MWKIIVCEWFFVHSNNIIKGRDKNISKNGRRRSTSEVYRRQTEVFYWSMSTSRKLQSGNRKPQSGRHLCLKIKIWNNLPGAMKTDIFRRSTSTTQKHQSGRRQRLMSTTDFFMVNVRLTFSSRPNQRLQHNNRSTNFESWLRVKRVLIHLEHETPERTLIHWYLANSHSMKCGIECRKFQVYNFQIKQRTYHGETKQWWLVEKKS